MSDLPSMHITLTGWSDGEKPCCRLRLSSCVCGCLCALCVTGPAVAAPDAPSESPVEVAPSVVVPPELLARAALRYPEDAGGVRGDVSVLVDVDAAGRVSDARFETGPEVFREAALEAARSLSFRPARSAGEPVAATTRVSFHFAPSEGSSTDDGYEEIVVEAATADQADTRAATTLDEADLARAAGDDLVETVAQVPGASMAGGTTDASKPILRGHAERRLLVLNAGVRHESQKWGPDHATEIDPFTAGSIRVVRGAAGARYGPDAIGGVILVEPPPLRTEPGVGGRALLSFASNGLRPYAALRLDASPAAVPGLSFRVEGNGAVGGTRSAPEYLLGNTASRTWNVGATVGYAWDAGQIRATWHHHEYVAGVFHGVRHATPAEFGAQFEQRRLVTADLWTQTYAIERAYQDVTHDVGRLRTDLHGSWGSLEATYAFQFNRRLEFAQVREDVVGPQYDFKLRTHSLDAMYRHPDVSLAFGNVAGGIGIQGTFQENVYEGYSLVPNYRSFGGGVFAYERLSLARVDLEIGGRFDALSRVAYFRDEDYDRHVRRGSLGEADCEVEPEQSRCPAAYQTGSVSIGAVGHVVPDLFDLKLDLSSASRFPNVNELYLVGTAPSFPVYALGRPNLGVETAWGASLTAGLRHEWLEFEASTFAQLIDDYIYFAPDLNDSGAPRFDVTIQGTWPRYAYQAVDAWSYGVDGSLSVAPEAVLGLDARGALVRIQERDDPTQLVGTPADNLHLAVVGRVPAMGALQELDIRVTADLVARQSRVDDAVDFAPAPDGYTLLGASIDAVVGEAPAVRIGFDARNLLNTRYRDYTSLLRYYADQPGRDFRVRVGVDF